MCKQTKVIHDRFDFQLAFMALVRNFCDDPNKEDLALLKRIYINYLPKLDWNSVAVAVRDLLNLSNNKGYGMYSGNLDGKPEMAKAVKPLLSSMIAYTLYYTDNLHYINEQLRGTPYEKETFKEDGLPYDNFPKEGEQESDDPFPVIGNVEDIEKMALHMVWYSRGRHTYMPGAATDFIKCNFDILSKETLEEIRKYIIDCVECFGSANIAGCDDDMMGLANEIESYLHKPRRKRENHELPLPHRRRQ